MNLESLDMIESKAWSGLRSRKRRRESKFISKDDDQFGIYEEERGCKFEKDDQYRFLLPMPKKQKMVPSTSTSLTKWIRKLPSFKISIPAVIGIIHVILNSIILLSTVYVVTFLLYFITIDILYNIGLRKEELRGNIREATRLYSLNRCDPKTRVPALEKQCGEWECMMKNGMKGINYTKIVIEVCAALVDSFIAKFSIKSCFVVFSFFILYFLFKKR